MRGEFGHPGWRVADAERRKHRVAEAAFWPVVVPETNEDELNYPRLTSVHRRVASAKAPQRLGGAFA